MPGILDYSKIIQTFGQWSTSEWRDMLLGRNLPPPIPEAIKDSKFATLIADRGNLINVDDVAGENIRAIYELNKLEGKLLEENSEQERIIQTLKNRFKPLNGYPTFEVIYTPYINAIAASLSLIGRGGADEVIRREYPSDASPDKFNLLSRGDEVGVQFPFNVIDTSGSFHLNDESMLGLSSAEHLGESISEKIAQVDYQSNPNNNTIGTITPFPAYTTALINFKNKLTGFGQVETKNLSENSVGWQEFNSSPKKNKETGLLNRINRDLGNYSNPTLSTEERVDSLLSRTSDTQVGFLLNALGMNPFVPSYSDRRLVGTDDAGTNSRYYIGSKRNTNRGSTTPTQFRSADFNDSGGGSDEQAAASQQRTTIDEKFKWEKETDNDFNEKTLLYETQNLVTENHDDVWIDQTDKFFKDKVKDRLISRGNAIGNQEFLDADFNGNYCRVWTVNDNYSYMNAIRNTGLFTDPDGANFVSSEKAALSVLGDNGIVKSHPTKEDSETTFKKYMFSLENLAWTDNLADLPLSEIGPGDLLSQNKGRIMWFPPYELVFDENVSANWTPTEFIGRGETLYTYNSTKRTGQLRFKMIVDHPRVINGYRGKRSNAIERFFAGCTSPEGFLAILDKNDGVSRQTKTQIENKIKGIQPEKKSNTGKEKNTYILLFKVDDDTRIADILPTPPGTPPLFNNTGTKLLSGIMKKIIDAAKTKKKVKITCTGFVAKDEHIIKNEAKPNQKIVKVNALTAKSLGKERAKTVWDDIEAAIVGDDANARKFVNKSIQSKGFSLSTDTIDPNNSRVEVIIENDSLDNPDVIAEPEVKLGDLTFYPEQAQLIDSMIINETKYFDFIDLFYPNYFANISEKIRYFQPGFHSTTPEGLNTRTTFLQQCMRQGPSVNDKEDNVQPQNLSFGRPPVLILRIGDYFYTKIVCNSLNITYEGGAGMQWDLNPSGIGVQPMVANVTMSIDIIGGQSLQGPIDRLQNAVSFNYYANTEMYDFRSDTIIRGNDDDWVIDPGESLGQLKKTHLGVDGVNALTESLKGEGLLNQAEINEKAANAEEFKKKYGIFIDLKGTDTIVVNSTDYTPGLADTEGKKPSEMSGSAGSQKGEKLVNNLLAIDITAKFRSGSIASKNIYKEKTDEETTEISTTGVDSILINFSKKIGENEIKIEALNISIAQYEKEIEKGETAMKIKMTAKLLSEFKKNTRKLKADEKELEKIKESTIVDIDVTAYYTEDKKASRKKTQFVYEGNKLSAPTTP